MAWFKVDDHFAFHPKVIAAGNGAIGLWVRAGAWSAAQMTDGFIPTAMIPALGASEADAEALASQGLWTPCEAGWKFHDWEQCQPTRAQVLDRREKRATAGRIGGIKSGQSRKSAGQSQATPSVQEASAEALASPQVQPRANTRTRPVPKSSAPTERALPAATPSAIETQGQRVNRLTKTYTDRVQPSNFTAVQGVVRKAVQAADEYGDPRYNDQEIIDALGRLADEARSVTADSLRYALVGFPATSQVGRRTSTTDSKVQAALELAATFADDPRGAA